MLRACLPPSVQVSYARLKGDVPVDRELGSLACLGCEARGRGAGARGSCGTCVRGPCARGPCARGTRASVYCVAGREVHARRAAVRRRGGRGGADSPATSACCSLVLLLLAVGKHLVLYGGVGKVLPLRSGEGEGLLPKAARQLRCGTSHAATPRSALAASRTRAVPHEPAPVSTCPGHPPVPAALLPSSQPRLCRRRLSPLPPLPAP
jgi:hypothetical protein